MADFYLPFSHRLTNIQIDEAKTVLKVNQIIPLSKQLQETWSNIFPYGNIDRTVNKFVCYLSQGTKRDYILVEGDFGVTFSIVIWYLENL